MALAKQKPRRFLNVKKEIKGINLMEQLPIDVMTQILFFLDIPARIKLSETNKNMEFLVNFRCSE